jgi:hypothetical protein
MHSRGHAYHAREVKTVEEQEHGYNMQPSIIVDLEIFFDL